MSRVGHLGRHPHCPWCGYDLVAAVAERGTTCPECGEAFELHEVVMEIRPGDWTPWRGAARLLVFLLVRTVGCGLGWAGALLVVRGLGAAVRGTSSMALGLAVIAAMTIIVCGGGVAIGVAMGRRLYERAGAESIVFAGIGVVAAWLAIWGGTVGVHLAGVPASLGGAVLAGAIAAGVVVKKTVLGDY